MEPTPQSPITSQNTNQEPTHSGTTNDTGMAIFAYILFFVPLIAGANSPFVRFHTNQGLVLFIFSMAGAFLPTFFPFLFFFSPFYMLFIFILWILGIVNVVKNEMKELPLIGSIRILK